MKYFMLLETFFDILNFSLRILFYKIIQQLQTIFLSLGFNCMWPFCPYICHTFGNRHNFKPHQICGQKHACSPAATFTMHKSCSIFLTTNIIIISGKNMKKCFEIINSSAMEVLNWNDGPFQIWYFCYTGWRFGIYISLQFMFCFDFSYFH